jgi:poly(3-hydroxybutyrate) depolymerase
MAGVQTGDRLKLLDAKAIDKIDGAIEKLQSMAPGEKVALEVERGDKTLTLEATLTTLPESLPDALPAAHAPLGPAPPDAEAPEAPPQLGVVTIKLPEFENECLAYVPETYDPRLSYGIIVWLHGSGGIKQAELVERWKPLCDQHDFILVAPKSSDRDRWQPTEARFVRRAVDDVLKNYSVDRSRVVVHGHEGGGAMAYLVGMANRDLLRAVAAVDSPLPRVAQMGETDPGERMAFYAAIATKSETTAAVEAGIARLRALKFPVTVHQLGEQGRYLTTEELEQLVRWFDSLDRI